MPDKPLTLGAILYKGFEILDMFGPLEMFTALAIIARLFGREMADGIAIGAEYTWHRDADTDPFSQYLNHGAAT